MSNILLQLGDFEQFQKYGLKAKNILEEKLNVKE